MKTLFLNGLKFTFNKMIDFPTDTNLFECFFFRNEVLVASQFLALSELNNIKTN